MLAIKRGTNFLVFINTCRYDLNRYSYNYWRDTAAKPVGHERIECQQIFKTPGNIYASDSDPPDEIWPLYGTCGNNAHSLLSNKVPKPKKQIQILSRKNETQRPKCKSNNVAACSSPHAVSTPARRSLTPLSAVKPSARKSRDDNNIAAVCAVQTFLVHQTKNRIPTPHAERDKKKLKIRKSINHASWYCVGAVASCPTAFFSTAVPLPLPIRNCSWPWRPITNGQLLLVLLNLVLCYLPHDLVLVNDSLCAANPHMSNLHLRRNLANRLFIDFVWFHLRMVHIEHARSHPKCLNSTQYAYPTIDPPSQSNNT